MARVFPGTRGARVRAPLIGGIAACAAVVLTCLLALGLRPGAPGARSGPLLAAPCVLLTAGALTAAAVRLSRVGRARPGGRRRWGVPVTAALAALGGTCAGGLLYLLIRVIYDTSPDARAARLLRPVLTVDAPLPWAVLAGLTVALPVTAGIAAASVTRVPPRRSSRPAPFFIGPPLVLAGVLLEYVVADPARDGEGRWVPDPHPLASVGYLAVLAGAALTSPWLVARIGGVWAARARRGWALCAARRVQYGAGPLTTALGALTVASATATTSLFAVVPERAAPSDLAVAALLSTTASCAAALLVVTVAEHGPVDRESGGVLRMLDADPRFGRRVARITLLLPPVVAVLVGVAVGVAAALPAGAGGTPFPAVSRRMAGLGTLWASGVVGAAILFAFLVVARTGRARR